MHKKRNLIHTPKSTHLHYFCTSLMTCKRTGRLLRKALDVCLSNSHTAVQTAAVLPWNDPKFQWVVWPVKPWTCHATMWQWLNTEWSLVRMMRISALWKTRTVNLCICEKPEPSAGVLMARKFSCSMQFPGRWSHLPSHPLQNNVFIKRWHKTKLHLTLQSHFTSALILWALTWCSFVRHGSGGHGRCILCNRAWCHL